MSSELPGMGFFAWGCSRLFKVVKIMTKFCVVQLLIAKAWVKALVTGYYRKDNFYQLNFMENLPESGENKVMGEFCSVTWFKIDGGSKVEWRRAGRDLVTSRDVRSYLHSEVEYKGTERDLKLLGKAVKVLCLIFMDMSRNPGNYACEKCLLLSILAFVKHSCAEEG